MRPLLLAAVAISALSSLGHDTQATPFISSSAYALSVNLTFNGVATQYGPIARVTGSAPPPYDQQNTVVRRNDTLLLDPTNSINPILQISATDLATRAASPGFGIDFISASGEANLGSVGLVLTNNPAPLLGLPSILGLSVSATHVRSQVDFSVVFPNRNFAAGDVSFGSLTLGGALIGRTLTFSGDAPANTVLFSSKTMTVTLDEKSVGILISCVLE